MSALEQAAHDGTIDLLEWPRLLEEVLQRLHDIVHNDFPLPQIVQVPPAPPPADDTRAIAASSPPPPSSDPLPTLTPSTDSHDPLSQSSVSTNKENAPPARPPVPSFSANNTPNAPSTCSIQRASPLPDSPLPPDLLNSYQSSTNILRNTFATSPPYTIQRLAELVLNPRRNYRFLPPFLSALDRAVSVTSPATDFPLVPSHVNGSPAFLTNGGDVPNGIGERGGLGSDESLGGALLTPIPWMKKREEEQAALAANPEPTTVAVNGSNPGGHELRTETEETIDGPRGAGRIETVSVTTNGITSNNTSSPNLSPNTTAANPSLSPSLSPGPFSPSSTSSSSSFNVHQAPTGEGEGQAATLIHDAELREQGAVTQGELIRQEQEAGVISNGQEVSRHPQLLGNGAAAVGRDTADMMMEGTGEESERGEDKVHARGPELIGMEDTGPQASAHAGGVHLDMEAAAGRKESPMEATAPKLDRSPQQESLANVVTKEVGDPVITEGNAGGVADTANTAAVVVAGEKRKRDELEEEIEAKNEVKNEVEKPEREPTQPEAKPEDEEMTDA